MRLTIEVTDGLGDIQVVRADTAGQRQAGAGEGTGLPASVPAGAFDGGADNLPRPATTALAPASSPAGTEGQSSLLGAPAGAIAAPGQPRFPAGEARSAGPAPAAYEGERYSRGTEVDIRPARDRHACQCSPLDSTAMRLANVSPPFLDS